MKYLLILSLLISIVGNAQSSFPVDSLGKSFFDKCLYVVDGVKKKGRHQLGKISPAIIERIEVFSNVAAIEKYGEKGRYGAILITTKRKK